MLQIGLEDLITGNILGPNQALLLFTKTKASADRNRSVLAFILNLKELFTNR